MLHYEKVKYHNFISNLIIGQYFSTFSVTSAESVLCLKQQFSVKNSYLRLQHNVWNKMK